TATGRAEAGSATGRPRTGRASGTWCGRSPTPTARHCSRPCTRWANGCWRTVPRWPRSGCRCRTGTTSWSTSPRSVWTTRGRCSTPRPAGTASSRAPCSARARRRPAWPGGRSGVSAVDFIRAGTLAEALAAKADRPDALPIAGGTDVMVELNFDRHRPAALLDLTGVGELATWSTVDGRVRLGAGVPYTRIVAELADPLPGLAMASRTVGSPPIRTRGPVA